MAAAAKTSATEESEAAKIEEQTRKMPDIDFWTSLGIRNGRAACLQFECLQLPNGRKLEECSPKLAEELAKTIGIIPKFCKLVFKDESVCTEKDEENFGDDMIKKKDGAVTQRIHVRIYNKVGGYQDDQFDQISAIIKEHVFKLCPAVNQVAMSFDQVHLGPSV